MEDDEIRAVLTRLARPEPSGGTVVERAAIDAEGVDVEAVMGWILAHGGTPEAAVEVQAKHGLHGSRMHTSRPSQSREPARFRLPAGALD